MYLWYFMCLVENWLTEVRWCVLVQWLGLSWPTNLPSVGVPAGPKVGCQSPVLLSRSPCSEGHFLHPVIACWSFVSSVALKTLRWTQESSLLQSLCSRSRSCQQADTQPTVSFGPCIQTHSSLSIRCFSLKFSAPSFLLPLSSWCLAQNKSLIDIRGYIAVRVTHMKYRGL